MKTTVAQEIEREGKSRFLRPGMELLFTRGAPDGKQSAHDDSDIEEVRAIRAGLERERGSRGIPSTVRQVTRGTHGRVQILWLAGPRMQVRERTRGVSCDFR